MQMNYVPTHSLTLSRVIYHPRCPCSPPCHSLNTPFHRSPFQAIAAGNTFLLKPSEKDAGAAVMLAEMAVEAGMPPGVLNVVHGTVDTVNFMCDDERIKVKGDGDRLILRLLAYHGSRESREL